jgi:hypothetical protein
MQNCRPSILLRNRRAESRSGAETADDAWVVEERRLEARRQRRDSYEQNFRVTHAPHASSEEERRERIQGLQSAHRTLHQAREAKKQDEKQTDLSFAKNQRAVEAQKAAEDAARDHARKMAAYEAGLLNKQIAEAKRAQAAAARKHEIKNDNAMIQQNLSAQRTFLY